MDVFYCIDVVVIDGGVDRDVDERLANGCLLFLLSFRWLVSFILWCLYVCIVGVIWCV